MSDSQTTVLEQLLAAPPTSLAELLRCMTPEIYASLRQAIELGKWQDGNRLSPDQIEHALQTLILYEEHHLPEDQRTLSSVPKGCGAQLRGGAQ